MGGIISKSKNLMVMRVQTDSKLLLFEFCICPPFIYSTGHPRPHGVYLLCESVPLTPIHTFGVCIKMHQS